MEPDITFMPLGGGQRVGASCYYLRIGESNIILDAGTGKEKGFEFGPDFHSLLTSPFIQSMGQIGQIFISHAHMDHVGYLLKLMAQAVHADVYMTRITKILSGHQLYDRLYLGGRMEKEDARLAAESLIGKVAPVSYMQAMDFGKYKVTFYPAGHIPGAAMILFEAGKKKILYTGDYSLDPTFLTSGCLLPENIRIDIAIVCGLHAKHPGYVKKTDSLSRQADGILDCARNKKQSVICHIPQLSKGIEFLKALNMRNLSGIPIYIDAPVMAMVHKMEQLSVPILNRFNKAAGEDMPEVPHILLTSGRKINGTGFYQDINIDFSLHEDFSGMKKFMKAINPKQAVMVHCAKETSAFGRTIEQEMMMDSECQTQFIFAEEKEIYKL